MQKPRGLSFGFLELKLRWMLKLKSFSRPDTYGISKIPPGMYLVFIHLILFKDIR